MDQFPLQKWTLRLQLSLLKWQMHSPDSSGDGDPLPTAFLGYWYALYPSAGSWHSHHTNAQCWLMTNLWGHVGCSDAPPLSSCLNCISWWDLAMGEAWQAVYPVWGPWLPASQSSRGLIPYLLFFFSPKFMGTWTIYWHHEAVLAWILFWADHYETGGHFPNHSLGLGALIPYPSSISLTIERV